MNQQLIFNNDFVVDTRRQAIRFSCLVSGLKINCFISLPANNEPTQFLETVKRDAFHWEDRVEQAVADDAYNELHEIWL